MLPIRSWLRTAARLGAAALLVNLPAAVRADDSAAPKPVPLRRSVPLGPKPEGGGRAGVIETRSSAGSLSPSALPEGLASAATASVTNWSAYAWGYNNYGQLGNNSMTNSTVPVAVGGLSTGVTSLAAGENHSLAAQNGKVFAWGNNSDGELGNGTTTSSAVPIPVDPTDLNSIIAVAAGDQSSYALALDGSLWVWGQNNLGQLGLGNTTNDPTPQHLLPQAAMATWPSERGRTACTPSPSLPPSSSFRPCPLPRTVREHTVFHSRRSRRSSTNSNARTP